MALFPWQKPKQFLTADEKESIVEAIKKAETETSGEVRLFIESKCRYVDPVDRAHEVFMLLEMNKTTQRNGTLIYVAVKHRQAAVYGDQGIHQKVGESYWSDVVTKMLMHFKNEKLAEGLVHAIGDLGNALKYYFPFDKDSNKNELPDDIVFGK